MKRKAHRLLGLALVLAMAGSSAAQQPASRLDASLAIAVHQTTFDTGAYRGELMSWFIRVCTDGLETGLLVGAAGALLLVLLTAADDIRTVGAHDDAQH